MASTESEEASASLTAELQEARAENAALRRRVDEHADHQRQTERALRLSEERYRVLTEDLPIGVVIHGPNAEILLSNAKALELLGLSEDQLLGKTSFDPSWDVIHEDGTAFPGPTHPSVQALATRRPVRGVVMGVHRPTAQDRAWLLVNADPKLDPDGQVEQVLVTFADITDRKRVEAAVEDSERIRRLALQVGRIGAFEVDLATGRGHWTDELAEIWGIPPGFEGDFAAYCWAHTHPEDLPTVRAALDRGRSSLEVFEMDFRVLRADGDVRWIRWLGQLLHVVAGGPLTAVGVNQDVTDRKGAAAEKARLELELRQAQKMESVGRLAGGVAHDFNNMLGVILGNVEFALAQVGPTVPWREDLEEIRSAALRSADLTRQLLAFARKQTVTPKVLDLNAAMAGILTMLRRLIGDDLQLTSLPGRDLWPVRVDPSQVDQIITNLCVNARDAISGVGTLTIETANVNLDDDYCAAHAESIPGDYVRLTISDDGRGMDEETRMRLFEPFFTTKVMGKGTGLGLATVYGIVKQNHGSIEVDSEPGRGTTFKIYLPRHQTTPLPARMEEVSVPPVRGHETVLLVEDATAVLKVSKRMLEQLGYVVLSAGTPGEAMRLAKEHAGEVQLLVTDVVMPEMNGRDLAENLLSLYPGLKRLFMSGHTADVIAHHGILAEGVHFLQKPFSKEALAAMVRQALDGERVR